MLSDRVYHLPDPGILFPLASVIGQGALLLTHGTCACLAHLELRTGPVAPLSNNNTTSDVVSFTPYFHWSFTLTLMDLV